MSAKLFTVREIAEQLNLTKRRVQQLVRQFEIEYQVVDNTWVLPRSALAKIKSRKQQWNSKREAA